MSPPPQQVPVAEVHRRVAGRAAGCELRGGVHGARAVRAAAGRRGPLRARLAAPASAPACSVAARAAAHHYTWQVA